MNVDIYNSFFNVLKPHPRLTVSSWADQFRQLSSEAASEPGRWKTSRAEYQREIMDAVNDPDIHTIVIQSSAQIGKSEILNNVLGFFIHNDPAPILFVQPTLETAQDYSRTRIMPMLRDSKVLSDIFGAETFKQKKSAQTILQKQFPGGRLVLVGANSPSGLASKPIRILLFDEVDRYERTKEGDAIELGMKRTTTFYNRKHILTSTPTVKGLSRIHEWYLSGDQRQFYVPCPHCEHAQVLKWSGVHFERDPKKNYIKDSACYFCESCGAIITESELKGAVNRGHWKAGKSKNGIASFHLNELYSPWSTMESIVLNFLKSKDDPDLLRVWINTSLGEPFEAAGESVDETSLINRRESYVKIPYGVGVLVSGVDVQDDRIEHLIVGMGDKGEMFAIEQNIYYGDPSLPAVWTYLDAGIKKVYQHENGKKMGIAQTCIDTGYKTKEAYQFIKPRQRNRVTAIKGSSVLSNSGHAIIGKPSINNIERVRVYQVYTDTAKDILFSRLKVVKNEEGENPAYIHFNFNFNEDFFSQFAAEKRIIKYHKGFPRREYIKLSGRRNEAIDLFVYCLAAFEILNIKNIKKFVEEYKLPDNAQPEQIETPKESEFIPENKPLPDAIKRPSKAFKRSNWVNSWK